MNDPKKFTTALVEFATVALTLYVSSHPRTRAEFYHALHKVTGRIAFVCGKVSMAAELKYRQEVL
jgi:hypothetical protein